MQAGLLDIVEVVAAYHAGLMGLIAVTRPRLRAIGLMCLAFSAHMCANLVFSQAWLPASYDITSAFGLMYGPCFYLFVRGMAFDVRQLRWVDLVHALPALLVILFRPADPIPQIIGLPSLVFYIGWGLWELRRHRQVNAEIRADADLVDLRWVEQALMAFAALAALDIVRDMSGLLSQAGNNAALSAVILSVIALLSFMLWRARDHVQRAGPVPGNVDLPVDGKTTDSSDDAAARAGFPALDALVRDRELWREARLSLADLAAAAGLPAREVSRAINAGSGLSFSRYINAIRIEAVEALMADPDHAGRTVIELAYETGFNSKSAFNRLYREHRGRTPTEAFRDLRTT